MELKLTLDKPINSYWDGGAKSVFLWGIDGQPCTDSKGKYVRVGSWEANHWFRVALGKTDKLTLANAKQHLAALLRKGGITGKFEYVED